MMHRSSCCRRLSPSARGSLTLERQNYRMKASSSSSSRTKVDRRDQVNLQRRLTRACFTEEQTFENFDWGMPRWASIAIAFATCAFYLLIRAPRT